MEDGEAEETAEGAVELREDGGALGSVELAPLARG